MTALPAWMSFMKVATEANPRVDFARPPGVVTGERSTADRGAPYADDPDVMDEVFLAGTEPTEAAEPPTDASEDAGANETTPP